MLYAPTTITRGQTYHTIGRGFNGWSQAASFGDEFQTATNYPLVRIVNNATGHIFYAKTHDHNTMGVATRSYPTYTYFDVPANMETGREQDVCGGQRYSVERHAAYRELVITNRSTNVLPLRNRPLVGQEENFLRKRRTWPLTWSHVSPMRPGKRCGWCCRAGA